MEAEAACLEAVQADQGIAGETRGTHPHCAALQLLEAPVHETAQRGGVTPLKVLDTCDGEAEVLVVPSRETQHDKAREASLSQGSQGERVVASGVVEDPLQKIAFASVPDVRLLDQEAGDATGRDEGRDCFWAGALERYDLQLVNSRPRRRHPPPAH